MSTLLTDASRRDGHLLAARHVLGPPALTERAVRRRVRALDREFARIFRRLRDDLDSQDPMRIAPGGREWLLDNDFIIAEALQELDGALPAAFIDRLPGLRHPEVDRGTIRAEIVARELVRRDRGRVEVEEIYIFLEGYQEVRPLRVAELWALPSFLRLALLEALLAEVKGDAARVEVGPYILSLRTLAGEDWRDVVERLSRVETVLREDPAGIYPAMDFRTRDRYRREVERVATRGKLEEEAVARQVLDLARARTGELREGHVGYYLVDEGRGALFRALSLRLPWNAFPSGRRRWLGAAYFCGMAVTTLLLLFALYRLAGPGWIGWVAVLLGFVPALGTAVSLMNRLAGQFSAPRPLPRLDLRKGIPPALRTVVAVPVLLATRDEVDDVLLTLETNYQGNSDPALTFALLSDFPDAKTKRIDSDDALIAHAAKGIRALNEKYGASGAGPFLLLHRPRRWNPGEGVWMGWERKRGKLAELNLLLLGRPSELWVVEGSAARLEGVPFVLTLDADTRLPRGAAARLVGTISHPLNRPETGARGRVVRGYSVLQPRIEILPDAEGGTLFSRVSGGIQGLDLYAHAAFDVYQDLFDRGIFAGKGIYDVRAFEASLAGRTPENSLLSHDLFEGAHGRAGLVSDLILLEEFPGHLLASARRGHRWIRGDWQILPWLFPRVPGEGGNRLRNPLTPLSLWMIFDNLRRSLQPAALLLILLLGWIALPDRALLWTIVLSAVIGLPFLTGSLDAAFRFLRRLPRRADFEAEGRAITRALGRWAIDLALLPFEAWNACDAVVRALHRMLRSRRGLLQWTSAAATARAVGGGSSLAFFLRQVRAGPILGFGTATALTLVHGIPPWPVVPFLLAWMASPALARHLSVRRGPIREPIGIFPPALARLLARRVWGYYERFQGPEDHWLAPDHFQEDPGGEVAHRTSPTNIGMAMVAAGTAWDLGFIGTLAFITRTRNTVEGMRRLTRYRGHFLNWYETSTLENLHPLYVSTVDSGNLAAALLVTREGLREARILPVVGEHRIEGIVDSCRVVSDSLRRIAADGGSQVLAREVEGLVTWIRRHLTLGWEEGLPAYAYALEVLRAEELARIEGHYLAIQDKVEDGAHAEAWGAVHAWLGHLRGDVEQAHAELVLLFPWLSPGHRGTVAARELHDRIVPPGGRIPSLSRLALLLEREVGGMSTTWREGGEPGDEVVFDALPGKALEAVRLLLDDVARLSDTLEEWFAGMDFSFLYDRRRELFRIGFSVSAGALDPNHYDLLASEARIASAIAIAKGDAPAAHWLHLGRPFTWTDRGPLLASWAGTMFEYLMPSIFLRNPPETVLNEACRRAVHVQADFGRERRIPWGISESGYHVLSAEGHYQYRAFGVPSLGLRRESGTRLVVAPYASLMAISIAPGAVHRNLEHIEALDGIGPWGPYEALDFGRGGEWKYEPRVVRSYMSHHHGMILAALGNHLTGHRLVDRFHRDPRIGTVEPYLFERIPWRRALERRWVDRSVPVLPGSTGGGIRSWMPAAETLPAPVHHLASGGLVVSLGPDGRGGSRWGSWSVVRGGVGGGIRPGGPDFLVYDRTTEESWRPLPDPMAPPEDDQQLLFEPHRAEFMRKSRGLRSRMQVFLPPTPGVEVRRFTLTNESPRPRSLRIGVALEVALAPLSDDLRHPAFQKLFVRASPLAGGEGLLFERRPRRAEEEPPVLLIALLGPEGIISGIRWGTSREEFIGRGGTPARPEGLIDPTRLVHLSTSYHPLDPMGCAVFDLDLPPWGDYSLTLLLAVGPDRETVLQNAAELRSPRRREWARIQARARAEGELVQLAAEADDPMIWSELLSHILHPRRASTGHWETPAAIDLRQSTLWRWGISGDLPFILIEGDTGEGSPILAELVRAQRWWRARGERVDLVVTGRGVGEYQDLLRDRVRILLSEVGAEEAVGRPGGIHVIRAEDLGVEERTRLRTLAAFRCDAAAASLASQVERARPTRPPLPRRVLPRPRPSESAERRLIPPMPKAAESENRVLVAPSALGGFDAETGEYLVQLPPGVTTPAPWVNLVARSGFGFLVTESGGSFTWSEDAGEFRLTPWHNDPVLGLQGEVLYLRDEERGEVWTPSPGPLGRHRPHEIRHGWGFSRLEADSDGLDEEVTWHLHPTEPVKIIRLRLRNRGARTRRLSAAYFAEWVLGPHPVATVGRLDAHFDSEVQAVLAQNPFSIKYSERIAFLATDGAPDGMATDREEFLGSAGPLEGPPIGLDRILPGERVVAEGPPCAVLRREIALPPGGEAELHFYLGAVDRESALRPLLERLRTRTGEVDPVESESQGWRDYLGRVAVRTPEPGLDRLMNGWLPYQTIVSRLRGRTGFYQSGGAFGFRDQLQDVYTLLPLDPSLAAAHLEEAARRQFTEGDVLHWWHPGSYRGVRTHCSDDLLWLAWVLAQTVQWTSDDTLLDRRVPYLAGPPLGADTEDDYDLFVPSDVEESLWEHALRAVGRTAHLLSPRGLPLMGTGDWNDGMDRVGREGRGESIWLGWFFIDTCRLLIPIAQRRGEEATVHRLEGWSERVRDAIETHGWDGSWYRRAFFDDGSPLGSRESPEARIDSIAQSWGLLSGAADPHRVRTALDSAWRELVRERDGIALLLTPPFSGAGQDPGYIAAYAPGVRENGGQYTHAAAWLLRALAQAGEGERAGLLLRLLLPTRHAEGKAGTERYRVEPYVLAADVYGAEPHIGRGGWTWYTGSAGWLWRVVLEDLLGVKREGAFLRIAPCIPPTWDGFEVHLVVEGRSIEIAVRNPERVASGLRLCRVDGDIVDPNRIPLGLGVDAGRDTPLRIEVELGGRAETGSVPGEDHSGSAPKTGGST